MIKLFKCLCSAAAAALLLASCAGAVGEPELSEHIRSEALPLTGIHLEVEPRSLAVYKNIAFMLSEGGVTRLDLLTGKTLEIAVDETSAAIGCDGSRAAVVSPSALSVYDYDGELLSQIPLEAEISGVSDVAVSGNTVIFADTEKPANLYYADLKAETLALLPETWRFGARDAAVRRLGFNADGHALIFFDYNFSFAGNDHRTLEYDVSGGEAVSEYESVASDYGSSYLSSGCFGTDGEFYFVEDYRFGSRTEVEWRQFISKVSWDGAFSNVMLIDHDGLGKLGIEPQDIYRNNGADALGEYEIMFVQDVYSLEYADGESFVVWDQTANTLAAFNSGSELKPLVLLIPGMKNNTSMNILKEVAVRYTAQTGRQVVVTSYPAEEYSDRLRTKLLAGEADFDLFVSDGGLLRSILENSAYQPLDGYENLTQNFDGVLAEGARELMTADGGLFGVPMIINFWGCHAQTGSDEVPGDWTAEELFEFCDGLPDGKKVYGDRFMLARVLYNYVGDMVQKDGDIDAQELAEFLAKLKERNDRGVLCDGDSEPLLTYGSLYFNPLDFSLNGSMEYRKMTVAPTRSGTKYLEIEYSLLMSRNAENKDAAADYLALLTSEEFVYNTNSTMLLIGRDVEKNSFYEGLSDSQKEILAYSMTMYRNSKPDLLCTLEDFPQFLDNEVLYPVLDGETTPDDAAQKIADEVAYTYFE